MLLVPVMIRRIPYDIPASKPLLFSINVGAETADLLVNLFVVLIVYDAGDSADNLFPFFFAPAFKIKRVFTIFATDFARYTELA